MNLAEKVAHPNFESAFRLCFGANLKKLRREKNLTQMELSEKTCMSRPSLANMEKGQQSVSSFQLMLLSLALKVSLENLLPSLDEVSGNLAILERATQVNTSSELLGKALEEYGIEVTEKPSTLNEALNEFGIANNKEEE